MLRRMKEEVLDQLPGMSSVGFVFMCVCLHACVGVYMHVCLIACVCPRAQCVRVYTLA